MKHRRASDTRRAPFPLGNSEIDQSGSLLCRRGRGLNPLHAVISGHGHGFRRRINPEKRPRAGNEWIILDDAFVNFHAEARDDLAGTLHLGDFLGDTPRPRARRSAEFIPLQGGSLSGVRCLSVVIKLKRNKFRAPDASARSQPHRSVWEVMSFMPVSGIW